jgi:hypothetical protein
MIRICLVWIRNTSRNPSREFLPENEINVVREGTAVAFGTVTVVGVAEANR